ncbi:OsmC family protein [Longispora sp. K20-0274]|uniref:OsmC family protein n=1 Tax=Longispora sp. K20-0274 TaxID=3088255 RepID=UPI00399A7421
MTATHTYDVAVSWIGDRGTGTSGYRAYDRAHDVDAPGRPTIAGSADPAFRGDPARWNPEQLLVASVSQCHLLWYLHLCSAAGVVVTAYADAAVGTMVETADGGGHFTEVLLRPRVTVSEPGMVAAAVALHAAAHEKCFIANSVNFPVRHAPTVTAGA